MASKFGKTFPEMTEQEVADFIRLSGSHQVTYFDEKLNSLVGVQRRSVNAFFEYNGLERTEEAYAMVTARLYSNGSYAQEVNGHIVSIQL